MRTFLSSVYMYRIALRKNSVFLLIPAGVPGTYFFVFVVYSGVYDMYAYGGMF